MRGRAGGVEHPAVVVDHSLLVLVEGPSVRRKDHECVGPGRLEGRERAGPPRGCSRSSPRRRGRERSPTAFAAAATTRSWSGRDMVAFSPAWPLSRNPARPRTPASRSRWAARAGSSGARSSRRGTGSGGIDAVEGGGRRRGSRRGKLRAAEDAANDAARPPPAPVSTAADADDPGARRGPAPSRWSHGARQVP